MSEDKIKNEIVVKTKEGDWKIFAAGRFFDLPSAELSVARAAVVDKTEEEGREKKALASFYFHVDDERDARQYAQKQSDPLINVKIKNFILKMAGDVLARVEIKQDWRLNEQLKSIVQSRLRDVRNLAETRENLEHWRSNGGGRLSGEQIGAIMAESERVRSYVEEAIRTGQIPVVNQTEGDGAAEAKRPVADPQVDYDQEEMGRIAAFKREAIGPVEELRQMTLKDFRRLGASPAEAAEKIWQKINLLEDVSLLRRAEGIAAWKSSEVNRLYLSIGGRSITDKKNIGEVIEALKEKGEPFLSAQEFNTIADLNIRLNY